MIWDTFLMFVLFESGSGFDYLFPFFFLASVYIVVVLSIFSNYKSYNIVDSINEKRIFRP